MLDPLIARWFNSKFNDLTEPQSYAIPLIHQRKSVLVSSPTGSGKTLTAFLSIINELFKYAKDGNLEDRVYAVYVSPLKALANDINRNLEEPLREMESLASQLDIDFPKIRVAVRSGDTSQSERQRMLRKPPHILITTPESLALILAAPKFREKLSKVEYVIVDEIHEICDSKRGVFLSLTLERLQSFCPRPFVRVGLSATLAPIEEIAQYLVGYDGGESRPVEVVEIKTQRDLDLRVLCPTEDMTALPYEIVNSKMYDLLYEMIQEHRTTIVFTNTRSGTESIVFKLKERGLESVEAHHGSLAKETRLDVEERLKKGELKCVVSSTSLELGIDIGFVDLVVQVGSPKSVAKGLQRVGRAGHGVGQTSKGRILVFDKDDLVECAVLCRAAHKRRIDRVSISENCLDVLSQSLVGMSLEKRWDVDEALRVVRNSFCYRNLPEEQFLEVLRYLGSKDAFEGVYPKLWYDEGEERFGKKGSSRMIYFLNLGTIPEEANYKVFTEKGGMIGDLSEKFVERLSAHDVFVLGGKSYEYVKTKGMKVFVREAAGRKPTVPSWTGEMLPRSFDLSIDVASFRREMAERIDGNEKEILTWLSEDFDIDWGSAQSILSYFREQKAASNFIPNDKELAIEGYIDPSGNHNLIFHFPFGRRVNDALSRAYAFQITQHLGCNVSVSITDDSFMISVPKKISIKEVEKLLTSEVLENTLRRAIKDSELFKQRFRHTAARSFMILRNYKGREVSVGRQQVRSTYLLDALGSIEGVPVIDETYREIMEDVMDIKNADHVLEMLEKGEASVRTIDYSITPSPFAHNAILAGISDMVLMEDRSALLRELHRRVLTRVMGADVSEFEFTEDKVLPYFRQRIGFISSKDDILSMLKRTGPLRIFKEKGRSVYPYSLIEHELLDTWAAELLQESSIASVFMDDVYFVDSEDLPTYASFLHKQRSLGELEERILSRLDEEKTAAQLIEMLHEDGDMIYQALRKLEATFSVGRVAYREGKWYYKRRNVETKPRQDALDEGLCRFLECFAPASVEEISYALGIPNEEVKMTLSDLVAEGLVSEGRYLVSESTQYMIKKDYLRLKTNDLNVYDHRTIEAYRRSKQDRTFANIEECLSFLGDVGMPLDVFYRVKDFDLKAWEEMRRSGRILLGRFLRGRVRYVMAEDAPIYVAAYRNNGIKEIDRRVLRILVGHEGMSMRQLVSASGLSRVEVKESIDRLDRGMHIIRRFEEKEEWSSENVYIAYEAPEYDGNARARIIERFVRAYGPVSLYAMASYSQFPILEISAILNSLPVETISVGDAREEMYLFSDELEALNFKQRGSEEISIRSLYDPIVQPLWAAVSSRYGDRWIFPIVSSGRLVGGAEKWNMSGCIEIRELDLEDPELLSDALDALDEFMRFYEMNGYEIVRIREILGNDAQDVPDDVANVLEGHGYRRLGNMFAKGEMVFEQHAWKDIVDYIMGKQSVLPETRYKNIPEAVRYTGGFRSDQEAFLRCEVRVPLKRLYDQGLLVRIQAIPDYVTYCTLEFASLCRKAKNVHITKDMRALLTIIQEKKSISKTELFDLSPVGHRLTHDALRALQNGSIVYIDHSRHLHSIPDLQLEPSQARKEVVRHLFHNYGIFSAENLCRFMKYEMSMREIRSILSGLEKEGTLVKGFLVECEDVVHWMLKSDVDSIHESHETHGIVLTPEDNLHLYLQPWIRSTLGGNYSVVMEGPKIIGSFKGRLRGKDLQIFDFIGEREARRVLGAHLQIMGLTIRTQEEESMPDWEIQEFYEKTHPGEI